MQSARLPVRLFAESKLSQIKQTHDTAYCKSDGTSSALKFLKNEEQRSIGSKPARDGGPFQGGFTMKILIAGVGNIFHGDNGFGSEVIRELNELEFPEEVTVQDFGTNSYDLAYALANDYDLKILVDVIPHEKAPGTVSLIELDLSCLNEQASGATDPQALDPVSLFQMARSIGDLEGEFYIVGCEPACLPDDNARVALSAPVRSAIPEAIKIILFLVADALSERDMPVEMTLELHEP